MANENRPLVEVKPGDPITAGRFNGMQKSLRQEHIQHAHTGAWKDGLFDGAPIGTEGLADGAVTGAKIAATAALSVRSLAAESAALTGALKVGGDATLAALKVEGAAKITGELGVEGTAVLAALRVGGTSTLNNVILGSLAASGGISTPMLGVSGDLNYEGKLGKLDVAESGTATLRCYDLALGHSKRRGTPGRALVDNMAGTTKQLVINYDGDWPEVEVQSLLRVKGKSVLGEVEASLVSAATAMFGGKHAVVVEGPRVRVVWGVVNSDGTIVAGSGFSAEHNADRKYTWIRFDTSFASTPCVVAQQLGSGNTKDNALVDDLAADKFSVMTGDADGERTFRWFSFIAIGPI
jgi:hypothetical protein